MSHVPKNTILGLAWSVVAIAIWSGSLVLLRLGVTTSLNPYDLTALRFAVSGIILLPVICRQGFARDRLGLVGIGTLVTGFGALYLLLVSLGLKYVPASAGGALNPGFMAVFAVLGGWIFMADRMSAAKALGLTAILCGALLFSGSFRAGNAWIGHLIFVGTAAMWAAYTLVVRRSRIRALHAAAIVAVGSALLFLPVYAAVLPKRLFDAPLTDILLQGVFQGACVSVLAVFAFNRSAELLGPTAGAALPALIPLVVLGMGAVILGEPANLRDLIAAASIGLGVLLSLAPVRQKTVCDLPESGAAGELRPRVQTHKYDGNCASTGTERQGECRKAGFMPG